MLRAPRFELFDVAARGYIGAAVDTRAGGHRLVLLPITASDEEVDRRLAAEALAQHVLVEALDAACCRSGRVGGVGHAPTPPLDIAVSNRSGTRAIGVHVATDPDAVTAAFVRRLTHGSPAVERLVLCSTTLRAAVPEAADRRVAQGARSGVAVDVVPVGADRAAAAHLAEQLWAALAEPLTVPAPGRIRRRLPD